VSDDQAREALLEVAQELDRMRALMDALVSRVRELETRYEDDGKRVKPRPSGRGRKARSPSGLLWAPPINQQP